MKRHTQEKFFLEMTSFPLGLKKIILQRTAGCVRRFVAVDYIYNINQLRAEKAEAIPRNHWPNPQVVTKKSYYQSDHINSYLLIP